MKLYSIIRMYSSLQKILMLDLPYPKTRLLMQLRNLVKPEWEYYTVEEKKQMEKYGKKHEDGTLALQGNRLSFDSQDMMEQYIKKINELNEMEIDIEHTEVKITAQDIGEQRLSGEDIDNLKPFVVFEDN